MNQPQSIHGKRIAKERTLFDTIKEESISLDTVHHILSTNLKTGVSVNFPVITCYTSVSCEHWCYACMPNSRLNMSNPVKHALRNWKLFRETPIKDLAERIAKEFRAACKRIPTLSFLRWNGVGDLFPQAVQVINYMAEHYPDIRHLVYTRIPRMTNRLIEHDNIRVLFAIDKSSVKRLDILTRPVNICYLREDNEAIPDVPIRVIFPVKQQHKAVSSDERDCPCDRKKISTKLACHSCQLCWTATPWNPVGDQAIG